MRVVIIFFCSPICEREGGNEWQKNIRSGGPRNVSTYDGKTCVWGDRERNGWGRVSASVDPKMMCFASEKEV